MEKKRMVDHLLRGNDFCPICKLKIRNRLHANVDHIVPSSKGGGRERENLVPVHSWCNTFKGKKRMKHINIFEARVYSLLSFFWFTLFGRSYSLRSFRGYKKRIKAVKRFFRKR